MPPKTAAAFLDNLPGITIRTDQIPTAIRHVRPLRRADPGSSPLPSLPPGSPGVHAGAGWIPVNPFQGRWKTRWTQPAPRHPSATSQRQSGAGWVHLRGAETALTSRADSRDLPNEFDRGVRLPANELPGALRGRHVGLSLDNREPVAGSKSRRVSRLWDCTEKLSPSRPIWSVSGPSNRIPSSSAAASSNAEQVGPGRLPWARRSPIKAKARASPWPYVAIEPSLSDLKRTAGSTGTSRAATNGPSPGPNSSRMDRPTAGSGGAPGSDQACSSSGLGNVTARTTDRISPEASSRSH